MTGLPTSVPVSDQSVFLRGWQTYRKVWLNLVDEEWNAMLSHVRASDHADHRKICPDRLGPSQAIILS
jgi:hypothetical protein